jgi:hypothetical protein
MDYGVGYAFASTLQCGEKHAVWVSAAADYCINGV